MRFGRRGAELSGAETSHEPALLAPPSSNMVPSVLVTVFCCAPVGLFAILFAAFSLSAAGAGDYEDAARFSGLAGSLCWWALALGFVQALVLGPFLLEMLG
jgi:hypothetical protein